MKIGIFADVHNNAVALEAVLRRPDARACACIGVLVLIGGFFLRYCLCTAPFMDLASYL